MSYTRLVAISGRAAAPYTRVTHIRHSTTIGIIGVRGIASTSQKHDKNKTEHPVKEPVQARATANHPKAGGKVPPHQIDPKISATIPPEYDDGPSAHNPNAVNPFDRSDAKWANITPDGIRDFKDLPHAHFGYNQDFNINEELREVYQSILRQFRGVGYCFAYGSGVFPQSAAAQSITDAEFRTVHPNPPAPLVSSQKGNPKMVDLIFGVWHTEHFHSLNIKDHPDHYSFLGSLGAQYVTTAQERWGAGVYFHPYVVVNGIQIKYGVTSLDNLVRDLSTWDTLYLAGRLQKPVRILRDHPQVRFANQQNLIAAVRTAQLLMPEYFDEIQLYSTIAGLSYLGDPRMALPTESPTKIADIVTHNIANFRRLYAPIIANLPGIGFIHYDRRSAAMNDPDWLLDQSANHAMRQRMEAHKRGNIIRRLPPTFRSRLYFRYQRALGIAPDEFSGMMRLAQNEDPVAGTVRRRVATEFDMRIVAEGEQELKKAVRAIVGQTVKWPATTQSMKGFLSAGVWRSWRYLREKVDKWMAGKKRADADKHDDAI